MTTTAPVRTSAVTAPSGAGVLRGTYSFDFEAGGEAASWANGDVWWEQMTATQRQLVPENGAALCSLGIVDHDGLGYRELSALAYTTAPITANAEGTNFLPDGAVFAVRTRHGTFVKVQVTSYGYSLGLRWARCVPEVRYLLCRATIGSAPDWLVTRYVVDCSYVDVADGLAHGCGHAELGAAGGIVEGQLPDTGHGFPASARISVTLDFQPETGLLGLVKEAVVDVEPTGVNYLFEPHQVVQRTRLLFDLQPRPLPGDFLLVRWTHSSGDVVVASGQKLLDSALLGSPGPTDCEIVFVPDPIAAVDMVVDVSGTLQGAPLTRFSQRFPLSEPAVLLRAAPDPTGSAFHLVVAS